MADRISFSLPHGSRKKPLFDPHVVLNRNEGLVPGHDELGFQGNRAFNEFVTLCGQRRFNINFVYGCGVIAITVI